jgi:hypothetical protein
LSLPRKLSRSSRAPRDEARRLVEVEESGAAAESAERRLIHPAIGGAAIDL